MFYCSTSQADRQITNDSRKIKLERMQVSHTCDFLSLDWLVDNVRDVQHGPKADGLWSQMASFKHSTLLFLNMCIAQDT